VVKKPKLFIALCTLPALILTIVFMIVPMLNAIYLSFTSSTALSVGFNSKFVFLDNYIYMFKDKDFVQALFNTFKLMLVIPALTIFLSLVFAFILTPGEIFLSYGILFSKCCLYDRCRNRVVFCI
jgi:N-acetylglucosamine transport system permease protein